MQGSDDAERPVHARQHVGDGEPGLHRMTRIRASDAHQPRLALHDLVVARPCALWPVVPEPGDGADDQPRVLLVQPLAGEAEAVEHPGAEILRQHVAAGHQPPQQALALLAGQVAGDRLLVPVAGQEIGALRTITRDWGGERRAPVPRLVAAGRLLDLYHPGTKVTEE